jgi:hypothetical protein
MGKSKQETKQQQTVTPTNPAFVTGAVQNQQQRIEQLGQRDPREFVAPASSLQNAAFSLGGGLANRMGVTSFDFGNMQIGGDNQSGSGLLSTTSLTPPMRTQPAGRSAPLSFQGAPASWSQGGGAPSLTASPMGAMQARGGSQIIASDQIGQPDFDAYVSGQPDLAAEYARIQGGGFGPNLPASYDANGDGRVQRGEYGRFHQERFGVNEPQRIAPPTVGMPTQQQASQPIQQRDPVTGAAIGQVGATELAGPNPNDFFTGAGLLAGQVGMSGANTVGDVALSQAGLLGPAQGYRASGPAGVERGQAAGAAGVTQGQTSGRAQTQGFNAANPASVAQGQAAGQASAQGFNAAGRTPVTQGQAAGQAASQGFNAAGRAGVTGAGVTNAQASLLGDPSGYAASLAGVQGAGDASQVNLRGYDAAQGQASMVGALPTMRAAQIGQADIDRFMNPYLDDVVNSTQADMQQQFGQQRAALDARAAGAGAFGGSRFGVRESQLDGEQSRALGSTLGGLRADGFNTALNFADRDVGRRQDANASNFNLQGQRAFTDAAAQNQFGMANLDAQNASRAFSADAENRGLLSNQDALNTFALTDADAQNRANLTNAGLLSDANRFGADAANEFDRLNQQAAQQVGLANADAANTASRFNAGESNRSALDFAGRQDAAGMFSSEAQNRAALDAAGRQDAFGLANMDAMNRSALDAAGRQDAAGMFSADAQNRSALDAAGRSDAFGLANMDAMNRSSLDAAGRQDAASMFGADAFNLASRDAAGRADTMSMFNAGEGNRSALDAAGRQDAFGMANMDAVNRSLLDFAGRADASGQFNAGAMNDFARTQFGADTDANFRNADAMNNMSQFNAGQRDTNLARRLQAAGLLGDLGATVGAEDRANIGLLAGLGNEQRGIDREYRNAETQMAQLLGNLTAQQRFELFNGQNSQGSSTTTKSGPEQWAQSMQALGSAAQAGAIIFSDGRLKRNVKTLGHDEKGRRWVEYDYVWGGPRQRGVIAQEVAATDPRAVHEHESGFLMVDYAAL